MHRRSLTLDFHICVISKAQAVAFQKYIGLRIGLDILYLLLHKTFMQVRLLSCNTSLTASSRIGAIWNAIVSYCPNGVYYWKNMKDLSINLQVSILKRNATVVTSNRMHPGRRSSGHHFGGSGRSERTLWKKIKRKPKISPNKSSKLFYCH